MASYVKLEAHEQMLLKQIFFKLLNSCENSKEKVEKVFKIKRSKNIIITNTSKIIGEIGQDIEKIKEMLPEIDEKKKTTEKIIKEKISKKKNYKSELEKIRERISSLG